ncbi:MAG: helix-turn-helix domain-containing protein [Verrucomicrobiia bacterium]|jgi:predicted DNA-binding transcriptional regulator AlpA
MTEPAPTKKSHLRLGLSSSRPENTGPDEIITQIGRAITNGDRTQIFALANQLVVNGNGQPNETEEGLDLHQVARMLTVSERSVWRLVARGELAGPVHIGRSCRWIAADLHEYLQRIKSKRR